MPRVILIAFEGATTLDVAGPAEVFSGTGSNLGRLAYDVIIASTGGGEIGTTSGMRILTRELGSIRPRQSDLVLVSGAPEAALKNAVEDEELLEWLRTAMRKVDRIGSVCSGTFVLGAAGLVEGKRVTTHWRGLEAFEKLFPGAKLDQKAIFVQDGKLWTSAGVTTGIDMALAIVEQDHGRAVADGIAADLVLYLRRPGFQAQFSTPLNAQRATSEPLRPVVAWIRANLKRADVERLARGAGLSVRTLHRRCVTELGTTPAKLIESCRIEHVRTLLATTTLGMKALAEECGFGSATHLSRAFEREIGMSPREYRLLHGQAA